MLKDIFLLSGGEEPLPAHVPAVPFPGHGVLLWHVVLLWGAFQRHGQRESGITQSATGNKNPDFTFLQHTLYVSVTDIEWAFFALCFALQKLQVPNIPISKCAACLKPPVSEEDKLKRCTRCYRVGYCNQWVLLEAHTSRLPEIDLLGKNVFKCTLRHVSFSWHVNPLSRVCQRTHWPNHKGLCRPNTENVGLPFLVSVPESRLSYARLTQLLEGYSRYAV